MKADILAKFRNSNIQYLKLSAFTLGAHQACDRAPTFRCAKAGMSFIERHGIIDILEDNTGIGLSINQAFIDLVAKYPYVKESVQDCFKEKIYKGCLSLVWCFPKSISKNYTCCGQHRSTEDEFIDNNPKHEIACSTVDCNLF